MKINFYWDLSDFLKMMYEAHVRVQEELRKIFFPSAPMQFGVGLHKIRPEVEEP